MPAQRTADHFRHSGWQRIATVFEPIRPVPPITTIFIFDSS
jgi:hypothetical protein